MTPLPAGESKSWARPVCDAALLGCIDDGGGERMLARALDARGKPQQLGLVESRAPGTIAVTFGLPSVSVPVLSTTSVSTFSMRSSASAFLISTPACAPRPTPTMIDIGVARPSAQGQAMMRTATAATRPIGEARLRAADRPGHEGQRSRPRSPPGRTSRTTWSARRWIGARRALRLGDHLHDPREHACRAPTLSASMTKRAGLIERARRSPCRRPPCVTGMDSPVTIDSSTELRPSIELAVDRHLLARAHAQAVADGRPRSSGTSSSEPSVRHAARRLRREVEQRPDGARRSARARAVPAPGRAAPAR